MRLLVPEIFIEGIEPLQQTVLIPTSLQPNVVIP